MKTKSALSYYGSDSEVAPTLAALLDSCKHVTIPFVGGGAIIPWLKATHLVASDANELVINFYRVASNQIHALRKRCEETLSHPAEMELAGRILERWFENNPVEPLSAAWAYWCLCWVGRKGKGGTCQMGKLPSVRRKPTGGSNASRLVSATDDLLDWAAHFRRCEFEATDFRKLLPKVADNKTCGIYCDPPWVSAGSLYECKFDDKDHLELAHLLGQFQRSPIVIRYDDCPLVRQLYQNWSFECQEATNQSGSKTKELWITRRVSV